MNFAADRLYVDCGMAAAPGVRDCGAFCNDDRSVVECNHRSCHKNYGFYQDSLPIPSLRYSRHRYSGHRPAPSFLGARLRSRQCCATGREERGSWCWAPPADSRLGTEQLRRNQSLARSPIREQGRLRRRRQSERQLNTGQALSALRIFLLAANKTTEFPLLVRPNF